MATLQEIREKLKQAEQRGSDSNKSNNGDNTSYPFWNLKEGGESVIRFLPDGNDKNTFFWVERAMIKLPFAGIKGEIDTKEVVVQVPCMEMYEDGSVCPILSEVRPWFKDPSLESMARKYWKKRSFIFQGIVVEDGLGEKDAPVNPIRRFLIGPQIFTLIKASLVDPELLESPTDYVHGLDFRLKSGKKGEYADYSTSSWSRRERPLNAAESDAIATYGLQNLSSFLPKKPSDVELKVISEMFEASINGEPYDEQRWGQYYKPAGFKPINSTSSTNTSSDDVVPFETATQTNNAQPVIQEAYVAPVAAPAPTEAPVADAATAGGDSRAADILAMIRNRSK